MPEYEPHVVRMGGQEGVEDGHRLGAVRALEVAELDDLEDRVLGSPRRRLLGRERGGSEQRRERERDPRAERMRRLAIRPASVDRGRGGAAVPPSGPISSRNARSAPSPWRKPPRRIRV